MTIHSVCPETFPGWKQLGERHSFLERYGDKLSFLNILCTCYNLCGFCTDIHLANPELVRVGMMLFL